MKITSHSKNNVDVLKIFQKVDGEDLENDFLVLFWCQTHLKVIIDLMNDFSVNFCFYKIM